MAWHDIGSGANKAEVVVEEGEVFFFEYVGFGWEDGASDEGIKFRIVAGRKGETPLDDFGDMDYLLGALNPADEYPIRRVLPGPQIVKCQATNPGDNDKDVWARIDGWIVPKEVPR